MSQSSSNNYGEEILKDFQGIEGGDLPDSLAIRVATDDEAEAHGLIAGLGSTQSDDNTF